MVGRFMVPCFFLGVTNLWLGDLWCGLQRAALHVKSRCTFDPTPEYAHRLVRVKLKLATDTLYCEPRQRGHRTSGKTREVTWLLRDPESPERECILGKLRNS